MIFESHHRWSQNEGCCAKIWISLASKPEHTAASEAHVVFSFVSKLYFQKNLFKSVSAETAVSGRLQPAACTNKRTKISFSACRMLVVATSETPQNSQSVDMTAGVLIGESIVYQLKPEHG